MEITYLGHSCFKLKGKTGTVVIDPFDSKMVGLPLAKLTADIVICSHQHADHNAVDKVTGTVGRPKPFVIAAAGEYEVQGISVFGVASWHDNEEGAKRGKNTMFRIHVDDIVVGHLGDLGHTLSEKLVEELGDIDVLMVPVGGVYTIDFKQAVEVIEQIEPSIVLPMHYKTEGMASDFGSLGGVDDFLKAVSAEGAQRLSKLTVTQTELPEEREVIVLERV